MPRAVAPIHFEPPTPVGHTHGLGQPAAPTQPQATDRQVDVRDEIVFWGRQLSDHALFLSLGLVEERLRGVAGQMHRQWEQYRPRWAQVDPATAASEARYMAAELRSFKTEVLDRLNRGEWLGWLYPTFVDHLRRELDMFVGRINGQIAARQELCDYLRFLAEHASFAAHLLDPQERVLIEAATARAGNLTQLHQACAAATTQNLLTLSRQAAADLDEYLVKSGIGTPRVKSVVHPVLAEHVVREGRRAVAVIDQFAAAGVPL